MDTKVGQLIFRRVIKDCLADKTVLLVSYGLQYLRECDTIIYLEEGRGTEGTEGMVAMALVGV